MSDQDTEGKQRGGSRRSRGRSRGDDRSTRTRRSRSRSLREPRASGTRPSRSRSRGDRASRTRHSRDRSRDDRASRTRPGRGRSRHRSRSTDSTESLREQERELRRKRQQLDVLENEVRRKRSRIHDDERDVRSLPSRRDCPRADNRTTPQRHCHTRDRRLTTPALEHNPDINEIKNDNSNTKSDFFEEFLKLLKSKTGHSESFSASSLSNVIPEFDPMLKEQTINIWLDKVDECSEIYSWNDKQTVHYALPKLTGEAKTWYQALPSIKHTWTEWKEMLRESFPPTENYAELLTDMLNRRVRPGETFELYYFAKINLLNRCKIFGKQAVDCLLYAIEDRGVRVGAQAAKFDKPEDVLKFFKTIKSNNRNQLDTANSINRDRRIGNTSNNSPKPIDVNVTAPKTNNQKSTIKCFNCQGVGHPSFKCPKPLVKCTTCNFIGHDSLHCPKTKDNPQKDKSVLEVSVSDNTNDKYKIRIKMNGVPIICQVDLGSEATLVRKNAALHMGMTWKDVAGPFLRGLGNVPYLPLGSTLIDIEVQGILERNVEVFVVDDHLINCDVLLGHSFTERPTLTIVKTPTDLKFERTDHEHDLKLELHAACDVSIDVGEMIPIPVKSNISCHGNIYVNGSVRCLGGQEYYLMPGEYQVRGVDCNVLIHNFSAAPLHFRENFLITRARFIGSSKSVLRISDELLPQKPVNPKCGEQLTDDQKRQCEELLNQFKDCFSTGMHDLGFTNVTEMEIHLKDTTPVVYRPYRLAHSERKLVQDMVGEMLNHGIVSESQSPYASPIVLVKKKSGEKRLCVDYRALNSRTKRDHYPLPHIEDLLDELSGQSLFTSLDLASGYHQIPIAENSREKTAFVTPDGLYEYNRVPFGLANAPAAFQRAIHKVLSKSKVSYIVIYMDDILIPSKSFEEGVDRLKEVLGLLREAGFTLKMEKCNFFQERIDFLGFEIDKNGIRPGLLKTEAVAKFPTLTNQHEVRRFLGLASFFRRFVKGFAVIARPLTNLLRKDTPWKWSEPETQAFQTIKDKLIDRPILALYDHTAETQLHTDASKFGIAGILLQRKQSDAWRPVAYYSRQTQPDEMKLHSFELETLAVVSSLSKFRTYLIGIKFTIVSDCNALRSTFTKRDLVPRIARWWIQFLEFDCTIEYRPGERMSHVDALSRGPVSMDPEPIHTLDVLTVGTEDWISTVQSSDDDIKRIKNILEDSETPKIVNVHKDYTLKNGRVFRVLKDGGTRWVVPRGVRWQLLKANHDSVGHFGFEKTLERIRSLFWFAKMRKFVKKYVSSCLECAHHKLPAGSREGLLHPIPKVDVPFHTLHADHLGPFPKSRRGSTYILVMVDAFTKYVSLFPVRSTKTKESIRAFKTLFSYFGSPTRLITDRGTSFTSKKFKAFLQSIGTKHILNAVATPRANGQVERYNRTILSALGPMVHGKNKNTWEDLLPDVQLGINTTVHDVTKKTPTELLLGRTITNPSQGVLNEIAGDIHNDNVENRTIEDIRSEASEKIIENQRKTKERYDKNKKQCTIYKEGDLVRIARAVVTGPGQSKKLEAKCKGPYRIKRVLPNHRFLVEDTPLTKKGARYETVVAVDKIFPWLSFNASACSSSEDSDDEGNDGND